MLEEILVEYRGTLTAILVCLIGILGGFSVQRYLAYRTACNIFRSAFSDAVFNLTETNVPSAQVVNAFRVKHLAAIQAFRDSVPWFQRSGFDKATNHYRQCCDKCLETGIFAIVNSESTEYAKENRKALLDSVHRLLTYAKTH